MSSKNPKTSIAQPIEVYVVRNCELSWDAKKQSNGEIVGTFSDKALAEHSVKKLGYKLIKLEFK